MAVSVQGAAKFLDECDRAGLAVFYAGDATAVTLPGEDALEVAAKHR